MEFKLTPEEKQNCRDRASGLAREDKELMLDIPHCLDDLIDNLKRSREEILWDVPDIDTDEIGWQYHEMPDPYEDYTFPTIKLFWSKDRNSDREYEKLECEMLKEKRRRYENYLMLKKEFEDEWFNRKNNRDCK